MLLAKKHITIILMLVLCSLRSVAGYENELHNYDNETSNVTCWFEGKLEPCSTLEFALEGLTQTNNSAVHIEPGVYILNASVGDDTVDYRFYYMKNISIVGLPGDEPTGKVSVIIQCYGVGVDGKSAGLTFVQSDSIIIQGVALVGCGVYHNSTSQDFSSTTQFKFLKFYTAIYFLLCNDVMLDSIHINDTQGVGMVMYSTAGENSIKNSVFSNNKIDPSSEFPGGGGLYIEFSYCVPDVINGGYVDCTQSSLTDATMTPPTIGAHYSIKASVFVGNQATLPSMMANYAKFILPHLDQHVAFGRGGGLSVYFKGNCKDNTVVVSNHSLFKGNHALWGGGIFVEHQDNSNNNTFRMTASSVEQNTCYNKTSEVAGTGGGGVYLGYSFFTQVRTVHNNVMAFDHVNITQNQAYFGGGLAFYSAREQGQVRSTNMLIFSSCLWRENVARVGSAFDASPRTTNSTEGALVQLLFKQCTFENNLAKYASDTNEPGNFVGVGAVYVDSVPVYFTESVSFRNNSQTALASINAGLYFESGCQAQFKSNSGRKGGAVALFGNSFIQVSENTSMTFVSNYAEIKGGAIYGQSIGEHDLISSRNCFIRYSDITRTSSDWTSSFLFENNTVGNNHNLNSLYLTSLLTCVWVNAGPHLHLQSETVSELAQNVFCPLKNETNWQYSDATDQHCTHEIATSSAYFYSKNNISTPYHYPYTMSVVPGKLAPIPIRAADDRANDVTREMVLTAAIVSTGHNISLDSSSTYVHSNDSIIVYGEPNSEGVIKFETDGHRVIETTVNVALEPCPPGMTITTNAAGQSKCHCHSDQGYIFNYFAECSDTNFQTTVLTGGWIGQHNGALVGGQCPFEYCNTFNNVTMLATEQDLEKICTNNRTGTLCGKCDTNFAPAVNTDTFQCVECLPQQEKYNWLIFLITEYVPITIFFFIVILFNVSVTSGPANAFVFFAQTITSIVKLQADRSIPLSSFAKALQTSYTIPYNIWNLNFFRSVLPPFCISRHITMLQYISTGYITAFYPFLLVTVFYIAVSLYSRGIQPLVCLFQPIHRCFLRFRNIWNLERSVLHSLATFLLLSYTKFTLVSFILLKPAPLVSSTGTVQATVVYYDGSVEFQSKEHIPYMVVSIVVLIVFVLLPPIILIMPSISHGLQKLIKMYTKRDRDLPTFNLGPSWQQFLNAFHGCYKDGTSHDENHAGHTSNITDLRWFAGAYFLLRLVMFAMYAFATDWFLQMVLQQILYTVSLFGFAVLRPYKKDVYNNVDSAVFANLAIINTLLMYNFYYESESILALVIVQYILIICPLFFISVYVIYYLVNKHGSGIKRCLKKTWPTKLWLAEEIVDENEDMQSFLEHIDDQESGNLGGILDYSIDIEDARRHQSPLLAERDAQEQPRGASNKKYGSTV